MLLEMPDVTDADEKRIIGLILEYCEKNGLLVGVFDGEDFAVHRTSDMSAVAKEIGATGETTLVLYTINGTSVLRIGTILLVHGNGDEVFADYSWNPKCDGAMDKMNDLDDYVNMNVDS